MQYNHVLRIGLNTNTDEFPIPARCPYFRNTKYRSFTRSGLNNVGICPSPHNGGPVRKNSTIIPQGAKYWNSKMRETRGIHPCARNSIIEPMDAIGILLSNF